MVALPGGECEVHAFTDDRRAVVAWSAYFTAAVPAPLVIVVALLAAAATPESRER